MRWIIGILINAVIFIALAGFFDGFEVSGIGAAIGASFILSILNVLVKPILIILTLPVTILSLGLFLFVINAITLLLTDGLMGSSFELSGFGMAFLASIILSLVNLVIQKAVLDPIKEK
ncbi:phage holin family protein [Rossellomorea vietnamensis]|uniref:phage holin family protein n=1 Tax=Rossellomorea vietnamensis TaxID=218284 RepID=UPI001CCF5C06|nr:phage holin family protein [Rossellomorea vietnamensis]MCA0150608.1 phage holin family protein [Rossellomorea vietnamensis]